MSTTGKAATRASNAWFVTTHWSVVLSAQQKDATQADAALEALCGAYWYPLYAYMRRQGYSASDAQDLTQEFFARLVHKDHLQKVAPDKGKFRTFLLVALKRFLVNEWKKGQAQKRGGGCVRIPLAGHTAETRYLAEPSSPLTAEILYERRWALTLLDRVFDRLRAEFSDAGRGPLFEQLKDHLMAEPEALPYAQAASRLDLSEGAVKVAVHRLRRRFRELFREEVAHTVSSAEEIDDEIRHLLAAWSQ